MLTLYSVYLNNELIYKDKTIKELGKLLGVSISTIYRYIYGERSTLKGKVYKFIETGKRKIEMPSVYKYIYKAYLNGEFIVEGNIYEVAEELDCTYQALNGYFNRNGSTLNGKPYVITRVQNPEYVSRNYDHSVKMQEINQEKEDESYSTLLNAIKRDSHKPPCYMTFVRKKDFTIRLSIDLGSDYKFEEKGKYIYIYYIGKWKV